jgi:Ca2+/Na+ antiporter
MIIEIIVLLGFLCSIVGFIFFTKHYFKTWKKKNDNKRILLAIETAEDDNAFNDKFYSNVFDKIDFGNVAVFFLITGIIIVGFIFFSAPNNPSSTSSTGNQGVEEKSIAPIINESNNMSIDGFFPSFLKSSDGKVPFWIFLVIGGIMFWIVTRQFHRHSFY